MKLLLIMLLVLLFIPILSGCGKDNKEAEIVENERVFMEEIVDEVVEDEIEEVIVDEIEEVEEVETDIRLIAYNNALELQQQEGGIEAFASEEEATETWVDDDGNEWTNGRMALEVVTMNFTRELSTLYYVCSSNPGFHPTVHRRFWESSYVEQDDNLILHLTGNGKVEVKIGDTVTKFESKDDLQDDGYKHYNMYRNDVLFETDIFGDVMGFFRYGFKVSDNEEVTITANSAKTFLYIDKDLQKVNSTDTFNYVFVSFYTDEAWFSEYDVVNNCINNNRNHWDLDL